MSGQSESYKFRDKIEECRSYEQAYEVYLEAKKGPEFKCYDSWTGQICTLEKLFQEEVINNFGCRVVDFNKKTNTEVDKDFLLALNTYTNELDRDVEPIQVKFGEVSLRYYPDFGWTYPDGLTWLSSNC